MKPIVLYDQDCVLCRSLAELVGRRAEGLLVFESWQAYWGRPTRNQEPFGTERVEVTSSPDRIHVIVDGEIYGGTLAWEYILALHPDFKSLSWLAGQLGLGREVAKAVGSTADLLKRFCPRCRKKNGLRFGK